MNLGSLEQLPTEATTPPGAVLPRGKSFEGWHLMDRTEWSSRRYSTTPCKTQASISDWLRSSSSPDTRHCQLSIHSTDCRIRGTSRNGWRRPGENRSCCIPGNSCSQLLSSTLSYPAISSLTSSPGQATDAWASITVTAAQVQPASRCCVTLELVNHSETPIKLYPAARIAQLVFFKIRDPVSEPGPARYRYATGPGFSRILEDPDAEALEAISDMGRPAMVGSYDTRFVVFYGAQDDADHFLGFANARACASGLPFRPTYPRATDSRRCRSNRHVSTVLPVT